MRMSRRLALYAVGGGAFTQDSFTYTGLHEWIDDGDGNFRLKFKGSGIFTPLKKIEIDVFLVGAGGGAKAQAGGGGGGYTATHKNITLTKGTPYEIKIGGSGLNQDGEASSAFEKSANGGKKSYIDEDNDIDFREGGAGGSGGGGYGYSSYNGGKGGSDGSDGAKAKAAGGKGQRTTTREFGEEGATLYAGGGGGCGHSSKVGGAGGDGGGGKGGHTSNGGQASGTENTGGGGGSGSAKTKGGSGIVIIRNAREAA